MVRGPSEREVSLNQPDEIVVGYHWMFTPYEYKKLFLGVDREAKNAMRQVAKRRNYKMRQDRFVRMDYSYNHIGMAPLDYEDGPPPDKYVMMNRVARINVKWEATADLIRPKDAHETSNGHHPELPT